MKGGTMIGERFWDHSDDDENDLIETTAETSPAPPADEHADDTTRGYVVSGERIAPSETVGESLDKLKVKKPILASELQPAFAGDQASLGKLADMTTAPLAKVTFDIVEENRRQMTKFLTGITAIGQQQKEILAALGSAGKVSMTFQDLTKRSLLDLNTNSMLKNMGNITGLDGAKMLKAMPGLTTAVNARMADFADMADQWRNWRKDAAERDRRNRDRAPLHITDQHVIDAMRNVDFSVFLAAQQDKDVPDDALLDQLETAINDPANIELRTEITRELLYVSWVAIAADWKYDGEDSDVHEWENEETGELEQFVADADDITILLFEDTLTTLDGWKSLADQYIERDILAGIIEQFLQVSKPLPPTYAPAFHDDGHGDTPSDLISTGARRALVARWPGAKRMYPTFSYALDGGNVTHYAPSRDIFPTPEDAWRAVERYSDAHADLLDYVLCKHMANKESGQRGPHGGFYMSADEFLDARGLTKHVRGGHKSENVVGVITQVRDLTQITVRGQVSGYTKAHPGKRSKREALVIEAHLLEVSQTIYRKLLDGTETPLAWYIRPGDWAAELEQFSEQYAITMQSILRLDTKKDANAKRIARYLIWQYRVRAREQSWKQPYRVAALLDGAGITPDAKNPKRFRERIEVAFDTLANPHEMSPPVIGAWNYSDKVEAKGRGWFDKWLESGVVIVPPDALTNGYKEIRATKRAPRKIRNIAG